MEAMECTTSEEEECDVVEEQECKTGYQTLCNTVEEQECREVTDTACDTVQVGGSTSGEMARCLQEEVCQTVQEEQCETVPETVCDTVDEQVCDTLYEDQCSTVIDQVNTAGFQQTSNFKNRSLDLTLSADFTAEKTEYVQTDPVGHILFGF